MRVCYSQLLGPFVSHTNSFSSSATIAMLVRCMAVCGGEQSGSLHSLQAGSFQLPAVHLASSQMWSALETVHVPSPGACACSTVLPALQLGPVAVALVGSTRSSKGQPGGGVGLAVGLAVGSGVGDGVGVGTAHSARELLLAAPEACVLKKHLLDLQKHPTG